MSSIQMDSKIVALVCQAHIDEIQEMRRAERDELFAAELTRKKGPFWNRRPITYEEVISDNSLELQFINMRSWGRLQLAKSLLRLAELSDTVKISHEHSHLINKAMVDKVTKKETN